ncbi:MAG: hypothetical protein HY821_23800 [Acidobacteria bacterium]|nr:hypothetical protein [Acidobacteriota bacterium]
MVLDGRYELTALLPTMAGALFQARDRTTGKVLLLRFHEGASLAKGAGVLLAAAGPPEVAITEDTPEWRAWSPQQESPDAGEFTRLFEAPGGMPNAAPAVEPRVEEGEFTRMFQPQVEQPEAKAQPGVAALQAAGEGEFTRFFRQPMAANPEALANPPALDAELSAGKPFSDPGEFTKFFAGPPQPASPPPQAIGPGEATGLFAGSAPAMPQPHSAESSEYTRFMRAAQAGEPAPAAQAAAPVSVSPGRRGMPAWLVGLLSALGIGVIILLGIALFR